MWISAGLVAGAAVLTGTAMAASDNGTAATTTAATTDQSQPKAHHAQFDNSALLSLLQIDQATLKQELKAGKSLADIAAEKGVAEQQVIDTLVQQATQRIDQAVQNGKLTQDKADQMKAKLADRVKAMVEKKGGPAFSKHEHGEKGGQLKEVATVLGITPQDLMTQLKQGKSIAQIAQDKGMTEDQVVNALLDKEKARITKFVEKTGWEQEAKGDRETKDDQTQQQQQQQQPQQSADQTQTQAQ